MRKFFYDDEEYVVCETAEELISMLMDGDEIMSNKRWPGDSHSYYCGSVPTYTYGNGGEPVSCDLGGDMKGWVRNAEDVKTAISSLPIDLELTIWREADNTQFFYNANEADLSWVFEV